MRVFSGGVKRLKDTWREASFTQYLTKNKHLKAANLLIKTRESPFLVEGEMALNVALDNSSEQYMAILEEVNKHPDSAKIYAAALEVNLNNLETDVAISIYCIHWQKRCFQEDAGEQSQPRSRTR